MYTVSVSDSVYQILTKADEKRITDKYRVFVFEKPKEDNTLF